MVGVLWDRMLLIDWRIREFFHMSVDSERCRNTQFACLRVSSGQGSRMIDRLILSARARACLVARIRWGRCDATSKLSHLNSFFPPIEQQTCLPNALYKTPTTRTTSSPMSHPPATLSKTHHLRQRKRVLSSASKRFSQVYKYKYKHNFRRVSCRKSILIDF